MGGYASFGDINNIGGYVVYDSTFEMWHDRYGFTSVFTDGNGVRHGTVVGFQTLSGSSSLTSNNNNTGLSSGLVSAGTSPSQTITTTICSNFGTSGFSNNIGSPSFDLGGLVSSMAYRPQIPSTPYTKEYWYPSDIDNDNNDDDDGGMVDYVRRK